MVETPTSKSTNRPKLLSKLGLGCAALFVLALAFLLMPAVNKSIDRLKQVKARTEIINLETAINAYISNYGRFPISSQLSSNAAADFTFGTFDTSVAALGIANDTAYQANNSEVMVILTDLTTFANGSPTVNTGHSRNPQQLVYINVELAKNTNSPGLGPDGVFRDPWGNPYIITFDLNNDKNCRDAFYRLASVSEKDSTTNGLNNLTRPNPPPYNSTDARNSFELKRRVMVWSLGPDGKADKTQKADEGVNKDNILSW